MNRFIVIIINDLLMSSLAQKHHKGRITTVIAEYKCLKNEKAITWLIQIKTLSEDENTLTFKPLIVVKNVRSILSVMGRSGDVAMVGQTSSFSKWLGVSKTL